MGEMRRAIAREQEEHRTQDRFASTKARAPNRPGLTLREAPAQRRYYATRNRLSRAYKFVSRLCLSSVSEFGEVSLVSVVATELPYRWALFYTEISAAMSKTIQNDAVMRKEDIIQDASKTSLLLRINGQSVGIFTSSMNKHAEIWMLDALDRCFGWHIVPTLISDEQEVLGGALAAGYRDKQGVSKNQTVFDVFLTRSPCPPCTDALLKFGDAIRDQESTEDKAYRMRLWCASIYQGERNRQSIGDIARLRHHSRLRIFRWNVMEMAQGGDISSKNLLEIGAGTSLVDRDPSNQRRYHKLDHRILPNVANTGALPYHIAGIYQRE